MDTQINKSSEKLIKNIELQVEDKFQTGDNILVKQYLKQKEYEKNLNLNKSKNNGKENRENEEFDMNYINYKELGLMQNEKYLIDNEEDENYGVNIFSLSKSKMRKSRYKTKKQLYKIVEDLLDLKSKILINTCCLTKLNIFVKYDWNFENNIFLNFEFLNDLVLYIMVRDSSYYVSYFKFHDDYNKYETVIQDSKWLFATPCLWQYKRQNNTLTKWLNNLPSFFDFYKIIVYKKINCFIINKSDIDEKIIKKYFDLMKIFNFKTVSTDVKGFYQEVTPKIGDFDSNMQ
jgi:hypothetical protein